MFVMKKMLSVNMLLVLLMLCGCADTGENTDTRFLLDTVVTLTAQCDSETLARAFDLCAEYEKKFSRTVEDSDVYRLNDADGFITVSGDTAKIIDRAIYYGGVSGGAFDITICPVSLLWDFKNQVVPGRDEIAEALKNVDYHSIETDGNAINPHGKQIDLGGIAKGYIADRLVEYFRNENVNSGIVNLGGNVVVFGNRESTVGIKKPFTDNELAARVRLKNKSVVTSGTYERYIERNGEIYHHILDPKTGYGVRSDLTSATIISDSSFDGDALSTVCILLGREKAAELIENTGNTEAVFIDMDGNISATPGLIRKGDVFTLK